MLDRFQNLPAAARIVLALVVVAVVIGLIALLAHFANPAQAPNGTPTVDPDNTVAPTSVPSASALPSATPDPSGPNDLAATDSPTDIYGKNRKFSDSQLVAATAVARKALLANCHYAPDLTAAQWVAAQRPYYQPDDFPYSESDHISVLSAQKCTVRNAKPQSQTTDGQLVVGVAATQETTYQEGAPIVPDSNGGKSAYTYVLGGTVTLKLVNGTWYAVDLDVSQQGN